MLVVEDDEDLRLMIARVLRHEGYEVREAADGLEALDRCDPMPDVILADLMMPRLDGEEFLRELRSRHPELSVPIVLITASSVREEVAARLAVTASVAKPFEIYELMDLVREMAPIGRPSSLPPTRPSRSGSSNPPSNT